MDDAKLTVATVLKPQGIRGEIKVKVFLDDGEGLKALTRVIMDGEEYGLLNVRTQGEFAYLALRGIADRNAAELLRGKEIEAYRSELPALPEDTFYIGDLIGCEVVASSGEKIGSVTDVTPARTDIYTLATPSGEVSFAAAEGVIETVDVDKKLITINKKRFKEVSV